MEPTEVKAHIQKGSFNQFYIFTGSEWKIQRIFLEQIAKFSGKELRYIDSISDIYHKKSTRAFVSKSYDRHISRTLRQGMPLLVQSLRSSYLNCCYTLALRK